MSCSGSCSDGANWDWVHRAQVFQLPKNALSACKRFSQSFEKHSICIPKNFSSRHEASRQDIATRQQGAIRFYQHSSKQR